jgi:hypothetical protein
MTFKMVLLTNSPVGYTGQSPRPASSARRAPGFRLAVSATLQVKQPETAVSTVCKIPMSTGRKQQMLTFSIIQAVSTNQAFLSPGGLQTTPSQC